MSSEAQKKRGIKCTGIRGENGSFNQLRSSNFRQALAKLITPYIAARE
jgi:hypothetical protein